MDTALPQKFPFILDRNLAKAIWTGNQVCTTCDIVIVVTYICHNKMCTHIFNTLTIIIIESIMNR